MGARGRDLLLTAVMLGILATPAWLLPSWLSVPWQIGVLVVGLPALWLSWRHAPWHPTPAEEVARIVALLDLGPDDVFADLGAGDGRLVLALHRATGARCVGLEVSPLPWLIARIRLALQGTDRTTMEWADLYAADWSRFDALYVWGTAYSVGTERFATRVREGLKPGARLVSYHHPVPCLEPSRVDESGQRPLYLYQG